MRKYLPNDAKTVPPDAECKFHGEIFDVYQWPQEMFDGSTATFEMLKAPDIAEIIAVKDNKIVITYQRQPREDWFYGYPGGRCDHPEEDELAAAKRELREETGMEFRNWQLINVRQPYSKIDRLAYTFLATDFLSQGEQQLDAGEEIKVLEVTFDELREIAQRKDSRYMFIPTETFDELLKLPALFEYEN